jgi:dipeptidyl-peptidase-4
MMRRIAVFALAAVAAPLVAQQRTLTAADYARAEKFLDFSASPLVTGAGVQPTWLPGDKFWYRVRQPGGSVPAVLVDAAKGTKANCETNGAACAGIVPAPGTAGPGGRRRGGSRALSPDGTKIAFIRDWNLWVREVAGGAETQLTTDGVKDFGYATDNAGWTHSDRPILTWSPDSKKIATFQQDQRKVGEMYVVKTRAGHPELSAWKYPLPGDSVVAMIQRVVIDLSGSAPSVVRFKMPADQHRSTLCDHKIGRASCRERVLAMV